VQTATKSPDALWSSWANQFLMRHFQRLQYWSPRHSKLENIIANAWSWTTEHRARVVVQTEAA
jgi:hypothetical protein